MNIRPTSELTPIEQKFLDAADSCITGLKSQQWIDSYRVDFVVERKKLVIELDGHEYHSSREQRTHDAKRERKLQTLGYVVIRFTGTEIWEDVQSCVEETQKILETLPEQNICVPIRERVHYCIRMKEVVTHLSDKFGFDVNEKDFELRLSMRQNWDDLFIARSNNHISVAHFYEPQKGIKIPDPRITFVSTYFGAEGYEDWAPIKFENQFPQKEFTQKNQQNKIVVTSYEDQHEVADFAENWAQIIRLQGWFDNATKVN